MTSAILFDLGGTLDSDGVAWKDRFFTITRESIPGLGRERFQRAFHAADDALVGAIPKDLSFRETVERLAVDLTASLDRKDLGRRVGERFATESEATLASRIPLLTMLASRYRLAVVSNFYGNLRRVLADVKLLGFFAVTVDSVDVGCGKPDPRIFRAALEPLRVAPEQALFVGDSQLRDMVGAKAVGMRHVWLHPEGNGGPPCCESDVVIRTLDQLPEALS